MCTTTKDIWEKMVQLCQGNDSTKENKFSLHYRSYINIKIKIDESTSDFDDRVSSTVNELTDLGKEYGNREIAMKG